MLLSPKVQKFAELIQNELIRRVQDKDILDQVSSLQLLDNHHCDLYTAIHGGGSRERIKNNSVAIAACALEIAESLL